MSERLVVVGAGRESWPVWLFQGWLLAAVLLHFVAIRLGALPRWTYGLLDALCLLLLVALLVHWRRWWPRVPMHWYVLLGLGGAIVLGGWLLNGVHADALATGVRRYLRFLPLALLPWLWLAGAATRYRQGCLLFGLLLLQVPLALHQRLAVPTVLLPGDHVIGTLGSPAFLSLAMLLAIAFLAARWLHGRMPARLALPLISLLYIPCLISETKAVLVLLPPAILMPLLLAWGRVPGWRLAVLLAWLLAAWALFFPVYDYFNYPLWGYGLRDFLLMDGRVSGYLHKGPAADNPGKLGSILLAVQGLREAPAAGLLGFGAGNVAAAGAPVVLARGADMTAMAQLLWDTGWLGLTWLLAIGALVFGRAAVLARTAATADARALGAGLATVFALLLPALAYKNLFNSALLWGMAWYLAGVVLQRFAERPGS